MFQENNCTHSSVMLQLLKDPHVLISNIVQVGINNTCLSSIICCFFSFTLVDEPVAKQVDVMQSSNDPQVCWSPDNFFCSCMVLIAGNHASEDSVAESVAKRQKMVNQMVYQP